jgi:hypothetical protein
MGVLDKMAATTASRRTVDLIMDEALDAEWRGYQKELAATADRILEGTSLAEPVNKTTVNKMEKIRKQVEASTVTFAFEKLDWRVRVRIQGEHPARPGNLMDERRGYNIETYTPALIRATCVSVTDAEGDTATEIPDELWDKLLGTDDIKAQLGFAQVDQLYQAATLVNDRATEVPPSALFLLGSPGSGESLAQPGAGPDSPPSGGKGGNRRTSRRTSTTKPEGSSAA